jgi:hypothetical protein
MAIGRVAVIFDDRLRPDTTGVHCRKALAQLVEVVHYHPEQGHAIPPSGFDLYLSTDDDTENALPDRLRPLAYWAIDTHRGFDLRLERAKDRRVRPQDEPSCLTRRGDPSRTDDAVRLRCARHTLRSGNRPGMNGEGNQPRMNTDEHGWDREKEARDNLGQEVVARSSIHPTPSDPCGSVWIRGSN